MPIGELAGDGSGKRVTLGLGGGTLTGGGRGSGGSGSEGLGAVGMGTVGAGDATVLAEVVVVAAVGPGTRTGAVVVAGSAGTCGGAVVVVGSSTTVDGGASTLGADSPAVTANETSPGAPPRHTTGTRTAMA